MIHSFLSTGWAKKGPVGRSGSFSFLIIFCIDNNVLIKLREKQVPVSPFYPTRAVDRKQFFI